jgi:HEAT repeat protein
VRRLAFLGFLVAVSPGLRAEQPETPLLIFRDPDPATEKEIRDLVTEKRLGGRDQRRPARERLAWIGPWAVPHLATALAKESSARIRMNAVIALMLVRDPRALPALRAAAAEDDDLSVRRAATLALGTFEHPDDVATLKGLLGTPRGEWTTVAPALARLRHSDAAVVLLRAAGSPPRDEHDAAAILLAAAIASPDAPLLENLEGGKLVQLAAAAGLAVRPPSHRLAGKILEALGRSKLTDPARVLAIRALGAIKDRPDNVQAALLDIACKDGRADERIAALVELDGRAGEFDRLWKAYGLLKGRNDPVVAALLLALARTREQKAEDVLLDLVGTDTGFLRFYAAAALLHANGADRVLEERIRSAVNGLRGRDDPALDGLANCAQQLKSDDAAKRAAAFAELPRIDDPRHLRLFVPREERNWREVNLLFATILQLDKLVEQAGSGPGREQESPLGGGGGGSTEPKKASAGTVEEQDLFDILLPPPPPPFPEGRPRYYGPRGAPERPPYFGKEDLLGAG